MESLARATAKMQAKLTTGLGVVPDWPHSSLEELLTDKHGWSVGTCPVSNNDWSIGRYEKFISRPSNQITHYITILVILHGWHISTDKMEGVVLTKNRFWYAVQKSQKANRMMHALQLEEQTYAETATW
jgi:hypothetical protein